MATAADTKERKRGGKLVPILVGIGVSSALLWWLLSSAEAEAEEDGGIKTLDYTAQPGDTLSKIAKKFLGRESLWPWIFDLNRQRLGENPDKLDIGQKVLIVPIMTDMQIAPKWAMEEFNARAAAHARVWITHVQAKAKGFPALPASITAWTVRLNPDGATYHFRTPSA